MKIFILLKTLRGLSDNDCFNILIAGVSWFLITLHASFYNIDSVLCPGEDELNLVMHEV